MEMLKPFILILSFTSVLNCYGQSDTKEDFVNEIYHTVVDSSYRYYYLSKNAYNITWNEEGTVFSSNDWQKRSLQKQAVLDSTIFEELYNKAHTDTVTQFWDFAQLSNARELSSKISNKMKVRNHTHSRIKSRLQKWTTPKEQMNIFFFSKPILSANKEYSIISMESYCGNLCASRCIYLFRKITGKWIEIAHFDCWMS